MTGSARHKRARHFARSSRPSVDGCWGRAGGGPTRIDSRRRWSGGGGRRLQRLRSLTLEKPQIERPEHQDHSNVDHEPLPEPEPAPEAQYVHADNNGYQRHYVKHDGCLSSHSVIVPQESSGPASGAFPAKESFSASSASSFLPRRVSSPTCAQRRERSEPEVACELGATREARWQVVVRSVRHGETQMGKTGVRTWPGRPLAFDVGMVATIRPMPLISGPDRLALATLGALGILALVTDRAPARPLFVAVAATVFILVVARWALHSSAGGTIHRFVSPYVAVVCGFELSGMVIDGADRGRWDASLATFDERFFPHLSVAWRNALGRPDWLTDAASVVYVSFYFVPMVLGLALYRQGRRRELGELVLVAEVSFFLSYVGYALIPARGPRLPMSLEAQTLGGGPISAAVRTFIDHAEINDVGRVPERAYAGLHRPLVARVALLSAHAARACGARGRDRLFNRVPLVSLRHRRRRGRPRRAARGGLRHRGGASRGAERSVRQRRTELGRSLEIRARTRSEGRAQNRRAAAAFALRCRAPISYPCDPADPGGG